MVEGVNAVAGSVVDAPDYAVPADPPPSNELGKDAFLKLLVAQLKYQDPMEPSSSEEFIATTAQFTVVEKLDELTKQGANTALVNSLTTASALVGREVTANRDGVSTTAVVNQSRIVSGSVVLDTDSGSISLNEIVSVGAAPRSAEPQAPATPVTPAAPTEAAAPAEPASESSDAVASDAASIAGDGPETDQLDDAVSTGDTADQAVDTDGVDGIVEAAIDSTEDSNELAPVSQDAADGAAGEDVEAATGQDSEPFDPFESA